ncbi:unnamed protein product [Vitrella brassicaformis CCMP3155]|uniref:Uncharacterized protein n=2 Tax=Vitrella brassicaformis TaxID=1169539 RepID=A0A0G4EP48_VITBC|nr:unnamed protein product [Vitrella brassicaformis CCMP3155]|eukprot:CEL99226.1 unnamed protein product [Vitrella brassicaformis CCMP3155]
MAGRLQEMLRGFQPPAVGATPSRVLVEFKAGKCNWDGQRVTPDKRKGNLSLVTGDDGLTHVQWTTRGVNQITEDDLIVINDAYLEKITAAKSGRVYVLKFQSSDKKLLFWMQEPDETKDEELITKFNNAAGGKDSSGGTSNAAAAAAAAAASGAPSGGPSGGMPPAMQQQLQQMMGGAGRGASNAATTDQLRSIMQNFASQQQGAAGASGAGRSGASTLPTAGPGGPISEEQRAQLAQQLISALANNQHQQQPRILPTPLTSVLPPERLEALLGDTEAMQELAAHMPEGQTSREEVNEAMRSAQLQGSMRALTQAIYSDQLPVLLTSMGLDANAARNAQTPDPMEILVDALAAQHGSTDTAAGAATAAAPAAPGESGESGESSEGEAKAKEDEKPPGDGNDGNDPMDTS